MSAALDLGAIKAAADLVRIVGETVPLQRSGRVWVGTCPFHGEKTGSFTVYPSHYHCYGCQAHGDAITWLTRSRGMKFIEAVAYLGGGGSGTQAPPAPRPKAPRPREADLGALALKLWAEAVDPVGTLVEAYLHSRSLVLPDEPVLRFHPRCPCGPDRLPAMVALMSDPMSGKPTGIHRTFLKPDGSGKADIAKPKMMLGSTGVIRLHERVTNGLGLTEGIETALAIIQRVGWGPVWAAGSDGGIRNFPVLPATTLNIFTDSDAAGMAAAESCRARWVKAGAEVWVHTPLPGMDWDDATQEATP
jgi:hypothetical protein